MVPFVRTIIRITYKKSVKRIKLWKVVKRIAVNQNECNYSRQHMLHVSVITDHPQSLSTYMIFKTQNKMHVPGSYIYRVFTKEWCGFKNLLNDYILQLDGAPPFSQECTRATQSWSSTTLDRKCFKWRKSHTHTIRDEFKYRVDVCRVTQGAYVEGLRLMRKKLRQLPLPTVYVLPV
jgi:hypothetical protein